MKKDRYFTVCCIKCGQYYISHRNTPVGMCQNCINEEEYFCNKCGQLIDYWEYNENVEGYCEDCFEEELEEDE